MENMTYQAALTMYNFFAALNGKPLKKEGDIITLNELLEVRNMPLRMYGDYVGYAKLKDQGFELS